MRRTTIGESLKQPPLLNAPPATGKYCRQNFVDYVNSLNVACKGYIFGIRAYQNLTITTVVWKYSPKHNLNSGYLNTCIIVLKKGPALIVPTHSLKYCLLAGWLACFLDWLLGWLMVMG